MWSAEWELAQWEHMRLLHEVTILRVVTRSATVVRSRQEVQLAD